MATDPIDPNVAKALLDEELAKVQAYHDAVAQEFAETDPEDVDQVRKTVRATVVPKVPDFVEQLVLLATSAASESVQLNAIKYGMDLALGKMAVGDADELANLLRGITKPASSGNTT